MSRPPRLGVISSLAFSLENFRGPLINEWVSRGLSVYAMAPDHNADTRAAMTAIGAEPVDISFERARTGVARDGRDLVRLTRTLRRLDLDITFSFFIKPVVYGLMAARMAGVPRRFAMIEGLGYAFARSGPRSLKDRAITTIASSLYGLSLTQADRVFFVNHDDRHFFTRAGMVRQEQVVQLDGIGVVLDRFQPIRPVTNPITFVMMGRLLREKGVLDYVTAARAIRAEYPKVRFLLLGGPDLNPGSLTTAEVQAWVDEGLIEWTGHVKDVRPWLSRGSVFVLPSYYREGLPRSIQEAMAVGLPIITTEAVGCRDTVDEGRNGFLVPVRDPAALAAAMRRFIQYPDLLVPMGRASRRIAEERFDAQRTNAVIIHAMGLS